MESIIAAQNVKGKEEKKKKKKKRRFKNSNRKKGRKIAKQSKGKGRNRKYPTTRQSRAETLAGLGEALSHL
jgi:hypothetical protein